MTEPPCICRECRHWDTFFSRVLDVHGDMTQVEDCEYGETPDENGRCIDVWPKRVEEEVPIDADTRNLTASSD